MVVETDVFGATVENSDDQMLHIRYSKVTGLTSLISVGF